MTGAPLPPGADAVIPLEDVEERGDYIVLTAPVKVGACVRPAGNDVHAGTVVLSPGQEIGARHIALLAALGIPAVTVVRRPVVAVLATGDELIKPGKLLPPGKIYNSNTPMLAAAITEAGGEPRCLETAGDDPDAIRLALSGAAGSNLILTSGGASVGDHDFVKDVVQHSGEVGFWRVRMRPGKPLIFGHVGGTPILGLPGNPTSAFVTFEQFVRPAIRTMLGMKALRPQIEVEVDDYLENRGGRRTYARVRLRWEAGRYHATLSGNQDSAMVVPLAAADGLLEIPEECSGLSPGDTAKVQILALPD
jgi:molybdopterin molybdotransferase